MPRYAFFVVALLIGGLFLLVRVTPGQAAAPLALTPVPEPATNTPLPPATDTPLPATNTPEPPPTNTPEPGPTHTPLPPTAVSPGHTPTPPPPDTLPETGASAPQADTLGWLAIFTGAAALIVLFSRRALRG